MLTLVQSHAPTAKRSPTSGTGLFQLIGQTVTAWRARDRARDALLRLDDRLLADIGLTREKQFVECGKPFWRA